MRLAGSERVDVSFATHHIAFIQAHDAFRRDGASEAARTVFLAVVDKGGAGIEAAATGTPYVQAI